jgi:hypothetical protein
MQVPARNYPGIHTTKCLQESSYKNVGAKARKYRILKEEGIKKFVSASRLF